MGRWTDVVPGHTCPAGRAASSDPVQTFTSGQSRVPGKIPSRRGIAANVPCGRALAISIPSGPRAGRRIRFGRPHRPIRVIAFGAGRSFEELFSAISSSTSLIISPLWSRPLGSSSRCEALPRSPRTAISRPRLSRSGRGCPSPAIYRVQERRGGIEDLLAQAKFRTGDFAQEGDHPVGAPNLESQAVLLAGGLSRAGAGTCLIVGQPGIELAIRLLEVRIEAKDIFNTAPANLVGPRTIAILVLPKLQALVHQGCKGVGLPDRGHGQGRPDGFELSRLLDRQPRVDQVVENGLEGLEVGGVGEGVRNRVAALIESCTSGSSASGYRVCIRLKVP